MTHYRMDDPHNQPPRDGTLIDLWQANGERIANARWNKTRNAWDFMSCHGMFITLQQSDVMGECRVTHWSPIVPPTAEPQESVIRWHGPEVAATAYRKGYEASEQAHPRSDNPYACKTSLCHQWWDAGWCQALDDLCGS